MPDDEMLSVAEVPERLKLNEQTVRNWIDRGELRAVRLGSRRVRIYASELNRFITDSSAAIKPDAAKARQSFEAALESVRTQKDGYTSEALRRRAKAANELARAL
jgi:excisionase family DNA binding protein